MEDTDKLKNTYTTNNITTKNGKNHSRNNSSTKINYKIKIKLKEKESYSKSNSNIRKRKKSPFVKRINTNYIKHQSDNISIKNSTEFNKIKKSPSKNNNHINKPSRSKSKELKKREINIKEELKDIIVNNDDNNNININKKNNSKNTIIRIQDEDPDKKFKLDELISKLLLAKEYKPNTEINLNEKEIKYVINKSYNIISNQPVFIELDSPINICGDVHGQFYDLLRLFNYGGEPPKTNYLFLGDYVDRGKNSLETIVLLLAYKIKYPENFFLLRGNHESDNINKIYGFYDECKRRFNIKIWKKFNDLFNIFPISAIIKDKILCMHGGLSPNLQNLDQLKNIVRPTEIPDSGLLCDLLWSDPNMNNEEDWGENERGVSYTFSENVVENFLDKYDLDLICRAHQVVENGYEFFANRQLVTIFSAPNYCGEFDNAGAFMMIEENLMCSFKILKPINCKVVGVSKRPATPPGFKK